MTDGTGNGTAGTAASHPTETPAGTGSPRLLQGHHERWRNPQAAATDGAQRRGVLSRTLWTWGTHRPGTVHPPAASGQRGGSSLGISGGIPAPHVPRHPNAFGQQERGSTAAHSNVTAKPHRGCSQAPAGPEPFPKGGSSAPGRNRRTLISQVGDHRKGHP